MDALTKVNLRQTPQSQPAVPTQVENSAGGYVFQVSGMERLRRFLLLGTDGGTFYQKEADLTKQNIDALIPLIEHDTVGFVDTVVQVSQAGRAPRNNAALFALALAAAYGRGVKDPSLTEGQRQFADQTAKNYAYTALDKVARTGTHLFLFARYLEAIKGTGSGAVRAYARWYNERPVDDLAVQVVKYRQREGWSHGDLLRLAHPKTDDPARKAVYDFALGRDTSGDPTEPAILAAFRALQAATNVKDVTRAIGGTKGVTWEMIPDALLNEPAVWEALLDQGVPITALIRQLPRLTRLGLTSGARGRSIAERITDSEVLRKGRVHPVALLLAHRTYGLGHGLRAAFNPSARWTPSRVILDALDAGFYAAYGAVEPTGKRTLLALDVSFSMTSAISGLPLSCREASAAVALVTANVEQDYDVVGFTGPGRSSLTPLTISPRQRLSDAVSAVSNLPFGGTDCALPMLYALDKRQAYDTFVIYTDNETWAGRMHPHQALERYRQAMGIDAKCVVVGMTATAFSIANPNDPGMLDVVGFDASTPNLISEFARGA